MKGLKPERIIEACVGGSTVMKIRKASGTVAILAFLMGCSSNYATKENVGTLTGATDGDYVGSQIGGGKGQLAATAAGAIAGALLGGTVGKSMDEVDRMKANQALESSRTGYTTSWRNPDTDDTYSITPTRIYETASGPCRDFTTQAVIDGKRETLYGTACRQPDGSWRTSR
jgi:surface antigen